MYQKLASIYDQLTFDVDYQQYAAILENIFLEKGIQPRTILEMAVGTGNLTLQLAKTGRQIIGFDQSSEMLAIAYNKLCDYHNVRLLLSNMKDFRTKRQFDCVLSSLDSLNYILDRQELSGIFHTVYKHLLPKGLFVFDLNSAYKLRNILGSNCYVYEKDHIFYSWQNELDPDYPYIHFILDFFVEEPSGLYRRFHEVHTEYIYEASDILEMLILAGFCSVMVRDFPSNQDVHDFSQRILFIAEK